MPSNISASKAAINCDSNISKAIHVFTHQIVTEPSHVVLEFQNKQTQGHPGLSYYFNRRYTK